MARVETSQTQMRTAATARARRAVRPTAISNWVIVTSLEAFFLLALTPALLNRYGPVGWLSTAAGLIVAGLTYAWYTGYRASYHGLVLFQIVSAVSLLLAVLAFLSTQPPFTALVLLALTYATASAFAREEHGAAIPLLIVLVIGTVVFFAYASKTARDRLDVTLLFLLIYALTGGVAAFVFNVRFASLRQPALLRYFGYAEPPALMQALITWQAQIRRLLAASYTAIDRLFRPLRSGSSGAGATLGAITARVSPQTWRTVGIAAAVVALLIFPTLVRWLERTTNVSLLISMNTALIFVVLALGLNIVVGFAGLLDLGYAAFFAIGAYTVGIFTWPNLGLEWSFWIVIWISAASAAVFGIIIGAPTLRLRGDYLAIVTLAFGEIVPRAIRELWDIKVRIPFTDTYLIGSKLEGFNLTNGPQGMNPVGRPVIFGHELGVDPLQWGTFTISPPMQWYFLIVVIGALVLLAASRLERSRLGRAWMAIREDETAADAMGVDPIRTKLLAFALGASFSGFAGSIYAAMIQAIFPELFSFLVSIFLLIIVIVSGMGNIWGVLLGGVIISLFDRVALAQIVPQYVPGGDVLQRWRWVMYAAGLIAVMVLRPEGLFPSAARAAELHEAEEDLESIDVETEDVIGQPPAQDMGGNW